MNNIKPSLGPWKVEKRGDAVDVVGLNGELVFFDAKPINITRERAENNAHFVVNLYNAWPELLETLYECADWLSEAPEGTDQYERGQRAMQLIEKLK